MGDGRGHGKGKGTKGKSKSKCSPEEKALAVSHVPKPGLQLSTLPRRRHLMPRV